VLPNLVLLQSLLWLRAAAVVVSKGLRTLERATAGVAVMLVRLAASGRPLKLDSPVVATRRTTGLLRGRFPLNLPLAHLSRLYERRVKEWLGLGHPVLLLLWHSLAVVVSGVLLVLPLPPHLLPCQPLGTRAALLLEWTT